MKQILDVSYAQPAIDYAAVAEQVGGVILRAGRTGWGNLEMAADTCYEKHYAGFTAAGVPVGAYYYSAADTEAVALREAQFLQTLLAGKRFAFPIYYDVENNERQGKLSREQLTRIVEAFCTAMEAAGYFVGYYSYTAWLQSKFDTKALSHFTLWKADYRTAPDSAIPCDMFQYTSSGTVAGIPGGVDLSHCYRDFPPIIQGAGLNGFGKPSPQPPCDPQELARLKARVAELEENNKALAWRVDDLAGQLAAEKQKRLDAVAALEKIIISMK